MSLAFVIKTKQEGNMKLISYQPNGKEEIAEKLEALLADYQIYERNIHKLMWSRNLRPYLDLGEKIEKLYHLSHHNTHQIGEQLLSLGKSPQVEFHDPMGLMKTGVNQLIEVSNYNEAISAIVHTSQQLLKTVEGTFYTAAQYDEKNTMTLMARLAWQLSFAVHVFHNERMALMN
jgi:starvation-inducible DNA-binding protein